MNGRNGNIDRNSHSRVTLYQINDLVAAGWERAVGVSADHQAGFVCWSSLFNLTTNIIHYSAFFSTCP